MERSRVERLAGEGDRRARRILGSLRNLSFELSGAQLGITATTLVLGAVAEPTIATSLEPVMTWLPFVPESSALAVALGLAVVLATATQMVFGELVPKNLALARPYGAAVGFGIPLQVVNRLLRPLIVVLNRVADSTVRLFGIEPRADLAGVRSMEELELMIRASGEGGELDAEEMKILTRAISFTENVAADAMVPRVSVTGIGKDETLADLCRLSRDTGHSRFPVYGEDLDDLVGIAHVKDSFGVVREQPTTPVAAIAKAPILVPETQPLADLLTNLRTKGVGMAVVVDEYGGTAGIVTVEDLLEEIVGEIEDEHDPIGDTAGQSPDARTLPGMLHRHEVEELTGFQWPEGRYETLGGFLVATLGRFPRVGEVILFGEWGFEVESMIGHRIETVVVHPPTVAPMAED